ncbi:sodium- and chloride-dependent betaine transporter-like [Nelusetta ayraudi]|uniref:sodium- and chloride-dependent betaine transporter-like n=1 Tax=Nelusetta ayraudi TaxID=303726 RepID=UPI003F71AF5F
MTEVSASSCPVDEGRAHPRARWANRKEFLFTMAGQMMDFRAFYIFPFLVYSFGGCAFFIPYGLALFFLTFPLLVLETAVGQYTSRAGATAWRMICPMFHGVGFASQIILAYLNIYNVVIPARILYYLYSSFHSPLPWTRCDGWYNSDSCATTRLATGHQLFVFLSLSFRCLHLHHVSLDSDSSAESEFYLRNVLMSLDDVSWTQLNVSLVPCLLIVWIICYFGVWKGAKYLGKVFYVTVPFSYLLLFIMLIRGLTADKMEEGLRYFLTPNLHSLLHLSTWMAAVSHALYSWSLGMGVLTSLGSYNQYNTDCYRDCLLLMGIHVATCILTCLTLAAIMGFLASSLNMPMDEAIYFDSTFIFVKFPQALSLMPAPSVWAVLFFLMMLFLSMNSQFVHADSLATTIIDLFPQQLRRPYRRELLVLAIAVVCFLLGLPLLTKAGENLMIIMDWFSAHFVVLLFIATFETISVAWVYGADRFYRNIEDMLGYQVFPVLKYCWLFITPFVCMVFIQIILLQGTNLNFLDVHPAIKGTLAFVLLTLPLMCVPVGIFVTLCKNRDAVTTPSSDLRQSRPHLPALTLCKRVIFRAPTQPCRKDGEEGENLTLEATGKE